MIEHERLQIGLDVDPDRPFEREDAVGVRHCLLGATLDDQADTEVHERGDDDRPRLAQGDPVLPRRTTELRSDQLCADASSCAPTGWRPPENFVTLVGMELIAHRAGNTLDAIGPASAGARTLELDVHRFRGRLEVRHAKVIWPFRIYWERSGLVDDLDPPSLTDVVAALPDGVRPWLDLKGVSPRLATQALAALGGLRPVSASCRSWWVLRTITDQPGVATFRSVGNRGQRWIATHVRHPDGVVLHERLVDAATLERLRTRCSRIATWGVESVERAIELDHLGVDALIVDDLALLLDLRNRFERPATG